VEGQIAPPCPACGGSHPEGAACPEAKSFGDWEQVQEAPSLIVAKLVALVLEEAGLEVQVLDQTFRQEPLPSVRAFSVVRVLVKRGQAEEARRILKQPRELLDFSDEVDPESEG
jgi:hypothetical protein